jgi:hypothetical protein
MHREGEMETTRARFAFTGEQKQAISALLEKNGIALKRETERQFMGQLERAVAITREYGESLGNRPPTRQARRRLRQFASNLERTIDRLDIESLDLLHHHVAVETGSLLVEYEHNQRWQRFFDEARALAHEARQAAAEAIPAPASDEEMLIELVLRTFERFSGRRAGRSVRFDTQEAQYTESGAFYELVQTVFRFAELKPPSGDRIRTKLRYRDERERDPHRSQLVTRVVQRRLKTPPMVE